uniref:NADH-ubiquinone oxidoreductase chain 4 n=1 Tax=Compsopogon caeruleus TaxID=31354 RepID=A0A1Z1XBD7_9RHOD|nr:NADH dehydrogenase subunit 4 [Compsopogon caeruleus]ARX96181.1 NADH dehydrogenase subunit 4 [Compsopogon caeruleus]
MQVTTIFLLILALPFVGILILLFIPKVYTKLLYSIALFISNIVFLLSLLLWIFYDNRSSYFQFVVNCKWFSHITYTLGIDGISLFFILLLSLLCSICILVGINTINNLLKEYLIFFLLLEGFLIQIFCVLDLFFFYIFFESVLIPMFLIIGIWGSRERKIKAAYQFFIYTLIGSLLMLIAILFIYLDAGTTNFQVLMYSDFTKKQQLVFWLAFFASFAVKIPMIPFHIWLPEAHAEAPTAGSVILAGILLKLGGYGFIRFSLNLFPEASFYFTPLIYTLSVVGTLYASLTTLRQVDFKKVIAYSSVAHMSYVTLGLFSFNIQAIEGCILLMLGHGLVASSLFLSIGMLYDRYKTRLIKYYGGLAQMMPIHAIMFMFFTFSSIAFPGTCNFVGEFLVLIGLFQYSSLTTVFACTGMLIGAGYSVWLYNRIYFGNWKDCYIFKFQDVSRREFWIFFPLVFNILWMGLFPNVFLETLHNSVLNLLINLIGKI